jgi:hypothetical protein
MNKAMLDAKRFGPTSLYEIQWQQYSPWIQPVDVTR